MREALDALEQGKFSEFSKKVKASLDDKIRNNPVIRNNAEKYKELSNIKDIFANMEIKSGNK